jgi:signal transduction histidine kinase
MQTYHQSVMKEMRRLGSLVEGFLTLARADQGEALARRTRVPVNDLVLESVAHCTAQAQQAGVHLVPMLADPGEDDGCLDADPDLLRTMLENLIRNAIRYSPAGRPVEIGVKLEGGHCVLTVRDHGPGVPEDFHEKVFDRYFVIKDDSCQGSNGLGLGLAIAKSVAQLHGGTITLCNAEGGGCLCTVMLPCEAVGRPI